MTPQAFKRTKSYLRFYLFCKLSHALLFEQFDIICHDVLRDSSTARSDKTSPNFYTTTAPPYATVVIHRIWNFQTIHITTGMRNKTSFARYIVPTFNGAQDKHKLTHGGTRSHLPASFMATTFQTNQQATTRN